MKVLDRYLGGDDPFQGDRTLWLRSLPADARVTAATISLEPVKRPAPSAVMFEEVFAFDSTAGEGELLAKNWGVIKSPKDPDPTVEVDFHARRTLAKVDGSDFENANLQVDIGGTFLEINNRGAPYAPGDTRYPVPADGRLPSLTVNKFQLTAPTTTTKIELDKVVIRSVPANVSVRLGDEPPFWMRVGELAVAQSSPNFAAVLNAFLAAASAEDGFYAIPFVVYSDTIARLNATLDIDYVVEKPVLPPFLPEVTLPYGFSSLPGVEEDLLTLRLPRGATITSAGGAVQGTFDGTRVLFGEIGESRATATATVLPERALAQPIQLDAETPVSGVDLPLANTEPGTAGLHLALQSDADGKPSGAVLTSAEVSVEKPVPGGSAWGSVALSAEFRLQKDVRYWLVLQSVSGQGRWDVRPGDSAAPLQVSTDGGFSWRTAATDLGEKPLVALFRLRHTPARFSVPLQLQVGKGPEAVRARFDRFAPLGRVEFDVDFAAELEEYLESPAAAPPCGAGELLTNGGFDQPPLDGAIPLLLQGNLATGVHSIIAGLDGAAPSISLKVGIPDGWQGEADRVVRVQIGERVLAVLVAPPSLLTDPLGPDVLDSEVVALDPLEPAELSQHIPVVGGCAYLLRFFYRIRDPLESLPPSFSRWQIRWLDDSGQALASDGGTLPRELQADLAECRTLPYEKTVVAPEKAIEAELRFIQRPTGILLLEDASFTPTLEALSNGGFQQWERTTDDLMPVGWTCLGGSITHALDGGTKQAEVGIRLRGNVSEDTVLTQTAEIEAGRRYELQIAAWPEFRPTDDPEAESDQQRAGLELRWLADDDAAGVPVVLPLDGRDFPTHAWSGTAPDGATQAEIRLVQPQGRGDLLVESVSLSQEDLVSVPLTFLAEAPGELTISDLRVTYHPSERPEPL